MINIKKRECKNYLLAQSLSNELSHLNHARKKILQYINDKDMSVRGFENKTQVGNGAVSKFLDGYIKSISLETAIKIAEALECGIDELIGKRTPITTASTPVDTQPVAQVGFNYNQDLYRSVSNYIFFLIDELRIQKIDLTDLKHTTINSVIDKIYKFCHRRNLTSVHREFAEILLYKALNLKIKPKSKT